MAQEIKKPMAPATPPQRYRDPFAEMRAEMDRVFDTFLGRGFGRFNATSRIEWSEELVPSIDVRETDTDLIIEPSCREWMRRTSASRSAMACSL